uniref:Reverse transcriptase domain-containing protein n=1 Tax=Hordeum vulgare subsp. vulgare TaxID=112509 RepID=A0A8I6YJK4_HORVV
MAIPSISLVYEGFQVDPFIKKGNVGIKVNDDLGYYFQTHKGLRQGDSMSPMLFNIIADMLAVLIGRTKQNGQVGELVPHLVEGGASILQYADDTIIFMEHDIAKARNMKLVLCLFEQLSGLKIIFNKANCSALGEQRKNKMLTHNYSVVKWDHCCLVTLEFPFIIDGLRIGNGNALKTYSKKERVVGRASLCFMEAGLC